MDTQYNVDVLILGGGMSGLAAGATAARSGAKVFIAEKGDKIGGSARLSAGMFWAPRNLQALLNHVPNTDVELSSAFLSDYLKNVEQIKSLGIKVADRFDGIMTIGIGYPTDVWSLFELEERTIKSAGGDIKLETRAVSLEKNALGRVLGAKLQSSDGNLFTVYAKNTILATGGFQGSSSEVAKRVGNFADSMFVRANPYSVGDGIRLAEAAGAANSRGMSTYYGHLMPSPLQAKDTPSNKFIPLAMYASASSIVVNKAGKRFCDETMGDEVTNQEVALQPGARGLILIDNKTYKEKYVSAPFPNAGVVDRIAEAEKIGCRVAHAESIDLLLEKVQQWGFDKAGIQNTLQDYNDAISGKNVALDAPLPQKPAPLREGPFHAVEVQPSITFTYGGIKIDKNARALDHDGRPISGLLVAGVDAGGFSNWTYAGGLALAYTVGVWAGTTASKDSEVKSKL